MDDSLTARAREMLDRQEIIDCLTRYPRAVDRLDADVYRSAFHVDALDYHGPDTLTPETFYEKFWSEDPPRPTAQHYLSNFTIEVEGDVAHSECYGFAVNRFPGSDSLSLWGGRYVDRLERRDGEWKVALRVVITEWLTESPALAWGGRQATSRRDPSDLSYERPLRAEELAAAAT